MNHHVILVFAARTGSSYFMQLCSLFSNSRVLCEYGEIFTNTCIHAIYDTFGFTMPDQILEKSQLVQHVLAHPLEYVESIEQCVNGTLFSKIQLGYLHTLPDSVVQSLLCRPNTTIIFLHRDPLDSFISEQKAITTNSWSNTNTTDLKVNICPSSFVAYKQKLENMYSRIIELCKPSVIYTFHYEQVFTKHQNLTPNDVLQFRIHGLRKVKPILNIHVSNASYIKEQLCKLNCGITKNTSVHLPSTKQMLIVQDKNPTPKKLANYEELKNL